MQESRILAEFSKDPKLIDFYLNGGADLHSYAVKIVYPELANSMSLSEIQDKLPEKRQFMKGFNFALAYGGTGLTVSQNLGIPLDIALEAEDKYFKAFNHLREYFDKVRQKTLQQGYVLINDVTNRKSFFHDLDNYIGLRSRLEQYANTDIERETNFFKGLSSNFWSYYRLHKERETETYGELRYLVGRYFRMQGSFERKGLNYPVQGRWPCLNSVNSGKAEMLILSQAFVGIQKKGAETRGESRTDNNSPTKAGRCLSNYKRNNGFKH